MTIEQKAKRYDEALKWMRRLYPTMAGIDKEDAEHYFPELRESENERIRGAIIDHLKDNNLTEWAAWLEKQGQVKEAFVSQHEIETCKENDVSLTSEDERIRQGLITSVSSILKGHVLYGTDISREEALTWLEKQGEKKPTDEEMKELLRTEYEKGRADAIAETQVAWSEEDKVMLDEIIDFFENGTLKLQHDLSLYASWLKALKERITNKQ